MSFRCPACGAYNFNPEAAREGYCSACDAFTENHAPPYAFTPTAGEISGFGGCYEAACRTMVVAGMWWLDTHPSATFLNNDVLGMLLEYHPVARELAEHMVRSVQGKGGSTQTMLLASLGHVFAARRMGWDDYCQKLQSPEILRGPAPLGRTAHGHLRSDERLRNHSVDAASAEIEKLTVCGS